MKKLLSLLSISTLTTSVPAPLLANTTAERSKRKTNPNQCGNSCRLEFDSIQNSVLILIDDEFILDFTKSDILLPNDLLSQKQFFLPLEQKTREIINFYKQNGTHKKINDYRVDDEIYEVDSYFVGEISNVKILFGKYSNYYRITSFSAEIPPFPSLEWLKQQSQFTLVDSTKTTTWTRSDLITVDGELNIAFVNPNIDKVVFDNVLQPQTNKNWTINVKPETAPRDHHLQVNFTLDGKPYTSEIMVSMQAKIDAIVPNVKENLSELVKKTDLGNILDDNNETIMAAINQKNANAIDDFSQLEITNKESNKATLTAKPDSTSYQGSVEVTYNVAPTTIVDLKIDLDPTASEAIVVKDYVGQIDPSTITNSVQTFYYANSESTITIKKPTISSVITGVVYGCDEQWNKKSQSTAIEATNGIKLDGSQLATKNGKYVVELADNLGHTNNIYLQIAADKATKNYFDTDNGKMFEQWALVNGRDNIRGVSARQLNNLFAASQTWPPQANGSENANSFVPQGANSNPPNNNQKGLTGWTVVGIIVGTLSGLLLLGWLLKKFIVTPLILEPIRKKKVEAFQRQTEKDIAQMKAEEKAEQEKNK